MAKGKVVLLVLLAACLCVGNLFAGKIIINDNELTKSYFCKSDDVYVNGNENVITLKGTINVLVVSGNGNKLMCEAIESIDTPGNNNYVSWETGISAAKPSVRNFGSNNIIKRVAIGSEAKAEPQPEKAKSSTASSSTGNKIDEALAALQGLETTGAKSTTSQAVSGNAVTINGDSVKKSITLVDQDLIVNGDYCDITVLGTCLTLSVTGHNNRFWLDSVARIRVTGDDNKVGWEDGVRGEDPSVIINGTGNRVFEEDR